MRFPLAALFFLVGSFIFFICWGVSFYLINTVSDAMTPYAGDLGAEGQTSFTNLLTLLPTAFGVICVLFFVMGLLLLFILDSLADEPEMYYRR